MSFCPVPAAAQRTVFSNAKMTNTPKQPKFEFCEGGTTTDITGPGTSSSTIICCPNPGPSGCSLKWESAWTNVKQYNYESGSPCVTSIVTHQGVTYIAKRANAGVEPGVASNWMENWDVFMQSSGTLYWAGTWANGVNYKKNAVILSPISGTGWVCMDDHTSLGNDPDRGDPGGSPVESFFWEKMQDFTKALPEEERSFIEGMMDGVIDWWRDAPLWQRVLGVAAGIGLAYAGNKIVESMLKTGDPAPGQESAESRYNGTLGYAGAYTAPTLRSVVASIMEFAGFTPSQYDVSLLEEKPVHFSITGGLDARGLLSQLALTYQFDVVPSGGTVKFVPKYQIPVRNLTYADLGHVVMDEQMSGPAPYTARRLQGIDLPRSITFNYYSSALDHNVFSQVAELFSYEDGQDVVISVPFTLDDEEAKRIVETTLVNAHIEQQEFTFTTDYHNIDLEPGDVITIPVGDGATTMQVRIKEVNETEDGILEFRCSRADYSTESYVASGVAVSTPPAQPTNIPVSLGYSDTIFIEVPPLNSDETRPRIVGVTTGYGRPGWPGANIYKSVDGGNTYQFAATNSIDPTWGIIVTPTPAPAKGYFVWDDTTTITVQLKEGALNNAEELGVLNGLNWAMVGEELIGFVNAQLVGPKTYTLSRLLRGRRGSEVKCGTHLANELFVLLDQSIVELEFPLSELRRIAKFKTVTIGSSLDKVDSVDIQPAGVNLIPWAPGHTKIVKDGQDFVITWIERPRLNNSLQDDRELVHDPDWGGFGVTIFTDNTATAVRRSVVVVVNNYRYTAAMQVQDFGSVQTTLKASVVQLSQIMGGGYPAVVQY